MTWSMLDEGLSGTMQTVGHIAKAMDGLCAYR